MNLALNMAHKSKPIDHYHSLTKTAYKRSDTHNLLCQHEMTKSRITHRRKHQSCKKLSVL